METDCGITQKQIDDIVTTDPSQINIVDTFMISHRNCIVVNDPADYISVFIEKLLKIQTYNPHDEPLRYFVGYTYSPMNAGLDVMENLGLNYMYLLCVYEIAKHVRHDYYRIAKKVALQPNCVNHLYTQRVCRYGRKKLKLTKFYMYIATNHLLMYFPRYDPITQKRITIQSIRQYALLEKKNIEKNRIEYNI